MHSSRMRTGRSLTVCCSLLPAVEGESGPGGVPGLGGLLLGGVCLFPGGCLLPGGGCLVCGDGSLVQGGWVPGPGGVWSLGGIPACTEADTPLLPVDRHTLVKTLPWPNFVAAGNNLSSHKSVSDISIIFL